MSRIASGFCRLAGAASRSPRTLVVLLALGFSPNAFAYLDPGSGSYLLQMAVAGVLAGMFTMQMYWVRVKDWFRSLRAPKVAAVESKDKPAAPSEP